MDPGFLEQVRAAVQLSLQGDKQSVEQSTNLLTETLIKLPGFLPALLAVSVNGQVTSKHCRLNWHKFVDSQPEFSEADRTIVKNEFLEALLRANDPEIVRLMGHCMHSILKKELSKNGWPDIEDKIWQLLSTNPTQERVYIALVALHALAKARQYYVDEDRDPISITTERFFPTLLQLGQRLLQDLNPVNAALARMIVKVYYRTIRLDLDAYLRRIDVNDAWIDLHYNLVVSSVKALTKMLEEKVPEAIYFDAPYWEIMKWTFRTVKSCYTFKYGEPDGEEEKYTDFATHWSQKYSLSFWNTIIDIVSHRKIIKVKTKTLIAAVSCIFNLITNDHVIEKNENLDSLLFDTMFDLLRFNQEQKEEYEDNPIEYFRKNDEFVSSSSTTSQVLNIFGKAFKNKKFLKDFMKWVNVCLTNRVNPRNNQPITVEDIEAIFHIIETHSIYVTKIKDLASILSPLLLNFVLPEMASPHGFLRMRACRMVTVYCAASFPVEMLKQISEGITKCLVDPDLPVRCCAAQALEVLLNKPELQQHFLPNLQSILQIYVKLINEFENDTLIQSLQGIFELYKDHIAPYAIELVKNLATLFFKCVEKEAKAQEADDDGSENEREVMESGFACQGCINAIEEIFKANDSQEVLQQSYPMIEPIFAYCFSDDGLDFLDDVANLMNTFVYKLDPFPPGIWSYFVIISYSLIGKPKNKLPDFPAWVPESLRTLYNNLPEDAFAQEMVGNLAEILKNFAYKGSEMLYSGIDFYGNKLIDVYFEVIVQLLQSADVPIKMSNNCVKRMLQVHLPHADTEFSSIAEVLTLAGFLLAQNHPQSVTYLPKVLEISVGALKTAPSQTVKDCFLYNLGYATWLNPKAGFNKCKIFECIHQHQRTEGLMGIGMGGVTLDCLHQHGVLDNVLLSWPDQHTKSVSYLPRKSSFIGMMSLYSLSVEELDKIKVPILDMYKAMSLDSRIWDLKCRMFRCGSAMIASLPKLYQDQQRVINLEFADSEEDDDEDLKNFGIDVDGYDDVDITEEDKPDDHARRQQQKKA